MSVRVSFHYMYVEIVFSSVWDQPSEPPFPYRNVVIKGADLRLYFRTCKEQFFHDAAYLNTAGYFVE